MGSSSRDSCAIKIHFFVSLSLFPRKLYFIQTTSEISSKKHFVVSRMSMTSLLSLNILLCDIPYFGTHEVIRIEPVKGILAQKPIVNLLSPYSAYQAQKNEWPLSSALEKKIICEVNGIPGLDFYSRFFAPWLIVDEDPVTGSAHTVLMPFWSAYHPRVAGLKSLLAK